MRIVYLLPALGAIIGGVEFLFGFAQARSAPQQGASAAMAVAWAVLPYVFARAVAEMVERPEAKDSAPARFSLDAARVPAQSPLTDEERRALQRQRTQSRLLVALIVIAVVIAAAASSWYSAPPEPSFYDRFPD